MCSCGGQNNFIKTQKLCCFSFSLREKIYIYIYTREFTLTFLLITLSLVRRIRLVFFFVCVRRYPTRDQVRVTTTRERCRIWHWISSKRTSWWTNTFRRFSDSRSWSERAQCNYETRFFSFSALFFISPPLWTILIYHLTYIYLYIITLVLFLDIHPPLPHSCTHRYRFTQIVADAQIKTPGGKTYDVLFVGTGKILILHHHPLTPPPLTQTKQGHLYIFHNSLS